MASNRQFAVFAKDSRLTLGKQRLSRIKADLAAYTEAATIFADGQRRAVAASCTRSTRIDPANKRRRAAKNVTTTYHFTENGQTAEKTVNVAIAGEVDLEQCTGNYRFWGTKITTTTQTYWPDIQRRFDCQRYTRI